MLCGTAPSPPRKKIAFGSPVKIVFWRFLLIKANGHNIWLISNAEYFVVYLTVLFRYLFFLQVKKDIYQGRYVCTS